MFLSHISIIYLPACRCGALSFLSLHMGQDTQEQEPGTGRKLEVSHLYNQKVMMSVEQVTCVTLWLVLRKVKRPLWWPHLNVQELKFGRSTPDLPADLPPYQSSIDTLNTLHQTWQIYPPSIEHRCLEYCYTKLGRSTHPMSIEHRCLEYHYTICGRSTPINRAYIPWILLHQTWQIYPPTEHRCLEYYYTKLGRSTPLVQCIMRYILWDVLGSHFAFFKKRWEFPFISE